MSDGAETMIFLPANLSDHEIADLTTAVKGLGFDGEVRIKPPTRTGVELWVILVLLPLKGALAAAGAQAFKHGWTRFRSYLKTRRGESPTAANDAALVLQDIDDSTRFVITPDVPPEALESLVELIQSGIPAQIGTYRYDAGSRRWQREVSDH